jgi:hypothetical protein
LAGDDEKMTDSLQSYYRYWGKARTDDETGQEYHLLPYHCLDVEGVEKTYYFSLMKQKVSR